jgi:L-aspartate oxidase
VFSFKAEEWSVSSVVSHQQDDQKVSNLVIGSGLAGMMLALKLAEQSKVLLISKGELTECNSYYAQGGIASVFKPDDSFEHHIQDTLEAGAGLCHADIVKLVIEDGPRAINELISLGVEFTKHPTVNDDELHLTREGGHSKRRVVHSADLTGQALVNALIQKVLAHQNIEVRSHQVAVDLVTSDRSSPNFTSNRCLGAYLFNKETSEIYSVRSDRTYLCTGGHGRAYLYTSNPDSATGDGLAMAWRAGCKVANLEFMQFHPTCLFDPRAKTFLVSEALRGEGGVLKNQFGQEFMKQHHPLGSLAPRDIVARAIDSELKKSGHNYVYLDVRHLKKEKIVKHFPNIYQKCLDIGIDISQQMIPVVPAAHYACGGVVVDEDGRTNIKNLFALGEVACSGLHGANRLASNSLLEALVYADRVANYVLTEPLVKDNASIAPWQPGKVMPPDEQVVLSHNWDEIRRLMWNYVGIVRTDNRLKRAKARIDSILEELDSYYWEYEVTESFLEVRNLAQVAMLTVRSALRRKESRGIHYNLDYPELLAQPRDTVI